MTDRAKVIPEAPRDITKSDAFVTQAEAYQLAGAHWLGPRAFAVTPRAFVAALAGVPADNLLEFAVEVSPLVCGYVVRRLRVRCP